MAVVDPGRAWKVDGADPDTFASVELLPDRRTIGIGLRGGVSPEVVSGLLVSGFGAVALTPAAALEFANDLKDAISLISTT